MMRLVLFYRKLLLDNLSWLRKVTLLFLLATVAGIIVFYYYPDLLEYILQVFEEKFGAEPKLDINLVTALFIQNSIAAGIALFGGIVFGIIPILVSALNGFLLGYVGAAVADPLIIVAGLLPHAIFEIPALLIASALGMKLGLRWMSREASGIRIQVLGEDIRTAVLAIPLIGLTLIVAGLIEVYVSGKLIQ